jgi:hypothetical protein
MESGVPCRNGPPGKTSKLKILKEKEKQMIELLQKFIEALTNGISRIAAALEEQNKLTIDLLARSEADKVVAPQAGDLPGAAPKAGAFAAVDPVKPGSDQTVTFNVNKNGVIPESIIHTGPENAGAFAAGPPKKEPTKKTGGEVWDPTKESKQGSYRAAPKQDAITAKLAELGITPAASWTWAKKHQAILDHVAQFGAVKNLTWDQFEAAVKEGVAQGKRDAILAAVQQIEGHQTVSPNMIQPANYQKIIDLANSTDVTPQNTAENVGVAGNTGAAGTTGPLTSNPPLTAPQAADYVPGVTAVSTTEQLGAYARYLMTQGVTPQQVQQAIAHIAPGIVAVPPERVGEAAQALHTSTGK